MIVRRGALTDHFVEGERSVVMVEESVLGLSPVATAILEAVPDGTEVDVQSVAAHVVATFGPPDGSISPEDITREQVWDLVAHKVLVVVEDEEPRDRTSSLGHHRAEDLSSGQPATAVSAVRDALRHLRSGTDGRWSPPASVSAPAFVAAARQHHVVPFLAASLDRLDIPAQARSELEAAAGRQRAGAAMLAADSSTVLAVLRESGVRAIAFKGVALAAQAYGDFQIRGAGDLDLLVAPADLARAHEALSAAGWLPVAGYPSPGPSWAWRHFVRTGNELTLSGDRSEIDLHWHLAPIRSTFPTFEALWKRRDIVSVDGHPTPTLSRYDALAHSAGHSAKDGWRWLRSLLDVHALMSDRSVWLEADRPLRDDQLMTVGLAAREFGTPASAPRVVTMAAQQVPQDRLDRVLLEQDSTAPEHRSAAVPGLELLSRLATLRLTSAGPRETVRLLNRSIFPPWVAAQVTSTSAVAAVPQALRERTRELAQKLRALR